MQPRSNFYLLTSCLTWSLSGYKDDVGCYIQAHYDAVSDFASIKRLALALYIDLNFTVTLV